MSQAHLHSLFQMMFSELMHEYGGLVVAVVVVMHLRQKPTAAAAAAAVLEPT
jgi:hypothetical protein